MAGPIRPGYLGGLKIQKVAEREPFFNMLVYGKPGVGKTVLAGSASMVPQMSKVLIVDVEGGTMSLRETFPNADVVRVKSWEDMQNVYDALFAGGHGYRTVVLDSLTEMQKFNMDSIMAKLVEANNERDMDVPGLREWGKNQEQIRRMVRGFRDLPMNTIFTALVREDKDRLNRPINMVDLSGKLAAQVVGFLDIVVYYYIKRVGEEDKRLLLTAATESSTAKDRSGKLPRVLDSPNMEKLYKLIIKEEQLSNEVTDADIAKLTAN